MSRPKRDPEFGFDKACEQAWRDYLTHFWEHVYPMFEERGFSRSDCWDLGQGFTTVSEGEREMSDDADFPMTPLPVDATYRLTREQPPQAPARGERPASTIHTQVDYLLDEVIWKSALPGDNSTLIASYRAEIHAAIRAAIAAAQPPARPTEPSVAAIEAAWLALPLGMMTIPDGHMPYQFLEAMLRAAYAVDFGAPLTQAEALAVRDALNTVAARLPREAAP